jgi:alkylation response protein AidB-like acyl-CoA dehydrogenase
MFLMPIHQDGVTVEQIRQVDGSMEFCQEFFDDVAIPASDVIGKVDDGWTVATALLVHERNATGGGSPYTSGRSSGPSAVDIDRSIADLAIEVGRAGEPGVRQLVGEERARQIVGGQLVRRITHGMTSRAMAPASSSLLKLFTATSAMRRSEIALRVGGPSTVTWDAGEQSIARAHGVYSLWRQGISLGGGSNEIQRNIISERLLGMPRELAADRDVPYREVRRAPGR